MTLHLYVKPKQEAMDYTDPYCPGGMKWKNCARKVFITDCCKRLRIADNLYIQVYYDRNIITCKENKGCNSKKSKSWFCTRHQVKHGPKTRYASCRERLK